jgi:hypothetical protein
LQDEIRKVKKGVGLEEDSPELAVLMTENSKLKHRLDTLHRVKEKKILIV